MENKAQNETQQSTLESVKALQAFEKKASTQVQAVSKVFELLSYKEVDTIEKATFAINSLQQIDGKSSLMIAKHLRQVKEKDWWKSVIDRTQAKPDFYKSFHKWASDNCNGIGRAQIDNLVLIAMLVDDNGKDILPKAQGDKGFYNSKQLQVIWNKCKNDIKDETASFNAKMALIKEMAQAGKITTTMSAGKLETAIKEYRTLQGLDKAQGVSATESKPTESKPTESKPTESKPTESKPTETATLTQDEKDLIIELLKDYPETRKKIITLFKA